MYADNRFQPTSVKNAVKPIMLDNRCTRNHKLYNQTMIHRNKVILKANKMEGMTSKEHFIQNKIEMAGQNAGHGEDFKTLAEI